MKSKGGASARGVSLWLVPVDEARQALSRLISELAARLGTPVFAPHVTLVTGVTRPADEVVRQVGELALALEPLSLPLRGPEGRDETFRCLYLPVGETLRLMATHALARSALRLDDERRYEPHLSLVYGTLRPEIKLPLVDELAPLAPSRVEFAALEVVRTEGAVAKWQSLARFPFGGPASGHERQ
jgi:2'-5' RNA ligase